MKKLIAILTVIAMCGFVLGACSDDDDKGPHCVDNPATCDPVCDIMAGQWCCGTTCQDMATCDPACDAATEYCDPCGGGCTAMPTACDPTCPATEWCDNGTCKVIPVCDPVCGATQYCSD